MQDNYTWFGKECFNQNLINGNFAPKPVGWLTYSGSQIDAASITNRFVQADYMKLVDNRLVAYHSYMYSIPLTINFECKIECDNFISALKIEQAIRETFYKNKTFFVQYRGMQIGCCVGFPESYNMEKTTDYSFDNAAKSPSISFSLVVESYQPVFDKTMEQERDKKINAFALDVHIPYSGVDGETMKTIKLKPFDTSVGYPSGSSLMFEWDWLSKDSDFLPVTVSYYDEDCPQNVCILKEVVDNQSFFIWNIPDGFSGYEQPKIVYPTDATIIHEPIIKIVPNIKDNIIYDTSFIVINRGYISYEGNELPITLEYEDNEGNPVIVEGYRLRLENGRVCADDPISVNLDDLHTYKGEVKKRKICVRFSYSYDDEYYDEIHNLLII